ncbi:MAG: GntR family transcriptional regulator [Flavobacteriales bacterium]|nr:GntR family transcriptional regulator [Flavobacteriales bacterium]
MILTGRIQDLPILRNTADGMYLGDAEDAVLLPAVEAQGLAADRGPISVFVYREKSGQRLATTTLPKAQAGEFTNLRVVAIRGGVAQLELAPGILVLVPHEEQKKPMEQGRWYVVRIAVDQDNDMLFASTRIEQYLDNRELSVKRGDELDLLVYSKSELGWSVIVNNKHQGLIHANEVYKPISIGNRITGYVKQVREDNKLDIVLQPIGYRQYIDVHTASLAKRLEARGFLPLTDKSSAEEIHAEFGISKKAFKKALGALYKERLVRIGEDGIVWMG